MIFDLGFHNGTDAKHYMEKGHRVIGVEPNPYLIGRAKGEFREDIKYGKLILVNKAVSQEPFCINFYLHKENLEWSSTQMWLAERDGTTCTMISVPTVTITELIEKYGTPYYMKVDTEGEEINIARELLDIEEKPQYISFETSKSTYGELFNLLLGNGYKRFQLINQANNPPYSSGTFGEYLPNEWFNFEELLRRYVKYADLKYIDNVNLALGWLDVHAKL